MEKILKNNLDRRRRWRYSALCLWSGIWLCRCRVFFVEVVFMVCLGSVGKFWMDDCPEVKVSGSWLKEFGFEYGHKVVVEVTKGQIVIKAVDVEDMDAVEGEEV